MPGIPILDKSAAMLVGAIGAAVIIVVVVALGTPFGFTSYVLLALGLAAIGWAALSRVSAAYS